MGEADRTTIIEVWDTLSFSIEVWCLKNGGTFIHSHFQTVARVVQEKAAPTIYRTVGVKTSTTRIMKY